MPELSTAFQFFLVGVKIDIWIVGLVCLLIFISTVVSFDGRCRAFFTLDERCSLAESPRFNFITFILVLFIFCRAVILALLIAPLLGLIIGHDNS